MKIPGTPISDGANGLYYVFLIADCYALQLTESCVLLVSGNNYLKMDIIFAIRGIFNCRNRQLNMPPPLSATIKS